MKIEKTKVGDQIYFGEIKALQSKKVKADKGTKGSPLFNQEPEADKNQLDIFNNENKSQNKRS